MSKRKFGTNDTRGQSKKQKNVEKQTSSLNSLLFRFADVRLDVNVVLRVIFPFLSFVEQWAVALAVRSKNPDVYNQFIENVWPKRPSICWELQRHKKAVLTPERLDGVLLGCCELCGANMIRKSWGFDVKIYRSWGLFAHGRCVETGVISLADIPPELKHFSGASGWWYGTCAWKTECLAFPGPSNLEGFCRSLFGCSLIEFEQQKIEADARRKREQAEKEENWLRQTEWILAHHPVYHLFKHRKALWWPKALENRKGGLQRSTLLQDVLNELNELETQLKNSLNELHQLAWWRPWSEQEGVRWLVKELSPHDMSEEFYALLRNRLPQPKAKSRIDIVSSFLGFAATSTAVRSFVENHQVEALMKTINWLAEHEVTSKLYQDPFVNHWCWQHKIPKSNRSRIWAAILAKEEVWKAIAESAPDFYTRFPELFCELVKRCRFQLKCPCGARASRKCVQGRCADCCDEPCDEHLRAHHRRILSMN